MSGERLAPLAGDLAGDRMATEACALAMPTRNRPAAVAAAGSGVPRRRSHLLTALVSRAARLSISVTGTYVGLLGAVRSRRGECDATPRLHLFSVCTRRSSMSARAPLSSRSAASAACDRQAHQASPCRVQAHGHAHRATSYHVHAHAHVCHALGASCHIISCAGSMYACARPSFVSSAAPLRGDN